ncbi:MAG TPA: hypothetical protein VK524_21160 [Polyangiaceae bacterium]|nr:hypothetical protein [Polyangiaceae bacterium]
MAAQGKIKGTLLVHLKSYALRNHGETLWNESLSDLPLNDRKVLAEPLIVGVWYPVGVWNRALHAYLNHNFNNPGRAMTSFAQYVAAEDLSTLFKLVLRVGSPEFVLTRTDSLYNRYFDTGRWTAQKQGTRAWQCELNSPIDEEQGPGTLSCNEGISAWVRRALELTGARARVDHVRCRFQGSPVCLYEVSW